MGTANYSKESYEAVEGETMKHLLDIGFQRDKMSFIPFEGGLVDN